MSTVEQTRDALHPSAIKAFEDAIFRVIDEWSIPIANRTPGPRHIAAMRAQRESSDLIWDMDIDELLDLIDSEVAGMIDDLIH